MNILKEHMIIIVFIVLVFLMVSAIITAIDVPSDRLATIGVAVVCGLGAAWFGYLLFHQNE